MPALTRIRKFVRKSLEVAKANIRSFVRGFYGHAETVAVLGLASVGASSVISYAPFYYATPIWINVSMIPPVLGVFAVLGLVRLAEFRQMRVASTNFYPL